jgi:MoxR-like ATPase
MSEVARIEARVDELRRGYALLQRSIATSFLGQEEVAELLLLALFADGHALLEGAPGLGKTTLVRALAASVDLEFRRVQFTPDLMPPDILGTRILEMEDGGARRFRFEAGPIFTHVLLADEINRATPRTQSALLEAMQERQVTLFGETRKLEEPFLVIATQNPIEMEGTYPLPEAQLDRFLFKIELAMPDRKELAAVLEATTTQAGSPPRPALSREQVRAMRALVRGVPASSDMVGLVSALVHATHPSSDIAPERVKALVRYGASPRGGQAILLAAKARALAHGRLCVAEEDVEALAAPALRHRILLGYEGEAAGVHPDDLVRDALAAARRVLR